MRNPSAKRPLVLALALGTLLGIGTGTLDGLAVLGPYWFLFPTAGDARTFALATLAIDIAFAILTTAATTMLLGPRAGWPVAVFLLFSATACSHLAWSFPSLARALGGRFPACLLAMASAALLGWLLRSLPSRLPRLGTVRRGYLAALVVAAALMLLPARMTPATGSGPNVLLLIVDTLRADRLGFGGSLRVRTPHLDRLSRRGWVMADMSTAINITSPSIASILTSTYVKTHGVKQLDQLLDARFTTAAEIFRAHGYRTFGFSSSFAAHLAFHQLDQGMDYSDDTAIKAPFAGCPPVEALQRLALSRLSEAAGWRLLPQNKVAATREADLTTDAVIAYLRRDDAHPFFGVVHYYDPHAPYDPPWMFSYYTKGLAGMRKGNLDEALRATREAKPNFLREPVDVRDPQFLEDAYDGEVSFVDHHIGRLLSEVKRRGDGSNTLFVFTADHGENLTEHGLMLGHAGLHQEVVHIPAVLAGYGFDPAARGVFVPPTRSIDTLPTVLEIVGIPASPETEGRSYASTITRRPDLGPAPEREAFASEPILIEDVHRKSLALRRGTFKLVIPLIPPKPPELYDLAHDPAERHNLAPSHPELTAELKGLLDDSLASGRGTAEERALDPSQVDALKALGYVNP